MYVYGDEGVPRRLLQFLCFFNCLLFFNSLLRPPSLLPSLPSPLTDYSWTPVYIVFTMATFFPSPFFIEMNPFFSRSYRVLAISQRTGKDKVSCCGVGAGGGSLDFFLFGSGLSSRSSVFLLFRDFFVAVFAISSGSSGAALVGSMDCW